ncbi:HlyD family type I secretion periplasmic adaptor subunit [Methylobacterium dankookense]|uniref:Membrane fusion protein (MFP) family protein n=1 Tax=Methylobacterium dankookense TaxID=560405 RepID=A0A564G332_9HYPH|nr:HlyD family type I secretion periplasmic adaptor subunit [Methylobacterium dankookense]GJD56372.1 Type I secretion system membrane fusion protein PrsE [Methylobacterium dankookense]VUF14370.1 Type I secretion system membrane fusion protein PrsE [Methylobacterium dankookense]
MSAPDDMRGSWAEDVRTGSRDILTTSSRVLLGASGLFVLWAVLCPLDSAVVADGVVIASGQNKVLQHRTGGVITEIRVRDGETVEAGGTVATLDPVHDQAELTRLRGRFAVLDAMRQRLEAENAFAAGGDGALGGRFNLLGLRKGLPDAAPLSGGTIVPVREAGPVDPLLAEQEREFTRGRGAALAEIDAMVARKEAMARRRQGLSERIEAVGAQVASLDRQVTAMRPVASRGHLARKTLWDGEDQLLARKAELANLKAEAGALADEMEETGSRIRQARLTDQRQTSGRLTDVIAEIGQIADQIRAAETAVRSTDLRAPVAGTVVHSKHATVGAVVTPGEVLAEIVPLGGALTVKARVAPTDITHVRVGLGARAKISALNARLYDDVPGVVSRVAADATSDERTGQHYFEVEMRLKPEQPGVAALLGAGMVGQVYIEGESRTFAGYILKPFIDSLGRSFREP